MAAVYDTSPSSPRSPAAPLPTPQADLAAGLVRIALAAVTKAARLAPPSPLRDDLAIARQLLATTAGRLGPARRLAKREPGPRGPGRARRRAGPRTGRS